MSLVGVVGGGQLGRMMALAGYSLGHRFRFLDPGADCPAAQVAASVTAAYDDPVALALFADGLDVVTYEFENVPVTTLDSLQGKVAFYPPRIALSTSQDRLTEKMFFQRIGCPTPRFAGVSSRAELDAALATIGLPAVLKTRRFGYDGKGQEVLRSIGDVDPAWNRLEGAECILEEMIPFDEELSIIAPRSISGEAAFYPIAHNTHRQGILRVSWTDPGSLTDAGLQAAAEQLVGRILTELDYVGVLALELFVRSGKLIANEMAPRVHNSGHWSIEGAPCSQFENHIRAVLGQPLGDTRCSLPCGMVNIVGELPDIDRILALPGAHLHLYGKQPRAGRKIGHVTAVADSAEELMRRLKEIEGIWG